MSLFSYNRPSGISWALSFSGTGGAPLFVTSSANLTNGRPAMPTRMSWLTGAPSTGQSLILTGTLPKAQYLRSVAALFPSQSNAGVMVPAGVAMTVTAKLLGSLVGLGGNSTSASTVQLPNGAVALWTVFPRTYVDTVIFTLPNNVGGSTWANSGAVTFDWGEAWLGDGADYQVSGLDDSFQGGVLQRQSHNNQAWPLQQQLGKGYALTMVPMTEQNVYGPNSTQDDWETVAYALSTQSAIVIIPAYMNRGNGPTANGQPPSSITPALIDTTRLNRTAKLGVLDSPMQISYSNNNYLTSTASFGETPP